MKRTVLLVDDDDMQRVLAREVLEQSGFNVLEANDGAPALELFDANDIDIVLLDVMMADLDGFATCEAMRQSKRGQHLPIVMMTGLDDVDSIDQAYQVGATDFVTKPINYSLLPHRLQYMQRAATTAAELRDSEQRLENAQRMAKLGHWEWQNNTATLLCSHETRRLLSLAENHSLTAVDDIFQNVHAQDRDEIISRIDVVIRSKNPFEFTFRVIEGEKIRYIHQEIQYFHEGTNEGIRATIQDISKLRAAEQQAHQSTYYDEVTKLPNRLLLMRELERSLSVAKRHERFVAVLAIDLDEFKRINDSLGHSVGDSVLNRVGELLKSCVRAGDIPGSRVSGDVREISIVSRVGGDEFVVILNDVRNAEDAAVVARRIREHLTSPITVAQKEIVLSGSIGISAYPTDGSDSETLLKNAVSAMNHAKAAGRDRYQFYTSSMNARAFERLSMETNLRKALQQNQFELHFQPKISLITNEISGAEALIRWRHPDLGLVSPVEFIPVAEETGLIIPLGEWIIHQAAQIARQWQVAGLPPISIAINISTAQFADPNLAKCIGAALRSADVAAECLEIEITESMLMEDINQVIKQLNELKALGIGTWIDDFGTGYSSLSYLKALPIIGLKIDQSFVRDMAVEENDETIVTAMIGLAHNLRLKVVAEGVEELTQLNLLAAKSCDIAQGYYFSKPVNSREFQAWVNGFMDTRAVASAG